MQKCSNAQENNYHRQCVIEASDSVVVEIRPVQKSKREERPRNGECHRRFCLFLHVGPQGESEETESHHKGSMREQFSLWYEFAKRDVYAGRFTVALNDEFPGFANVRPSASSRCFRICPGNAADTNNIVADLQARCFARTAGKNLCHRIIAVFSPAALRQITDIDPSKDAPDGKQCAEYHQVVFIFTCSSIAHYFLLYFL